METETANASSARACTVCTCSPILHIPGIGKNIPLVPVLASGATLITLALCYALAVAQSHAIPVWPFISDVAACRPETSIFAFLMSPVALLTALTYYIQYQRWKINFTDSQHRPDRTQHLHLLNIWSLRIGLVSCFGLIVAASFPMGLYYHVTGFMHRSGAVVNGWSCYVYWYLQLRLEQLAAVKSPLFAVRRLCVALGFLCGAVFSLCRPLVSNHFLNDVRSLDGDSCDSRLPDEQAWSRPDRALQLYVVSAICQWILTLLSCICQLSLGWEFHWWLTRLTNDRHEILRQLNGLPILPPQNTHSHSQ